MAHSAAQGRPYVSLMVTSNICLFCSIARVDITGIGLPLHLSSATNLYQILKRAGATSVTKVILKPFYKFHGGLGNRGFSGLNRPAAALK